MHTLSKQVAAFSLQLYENQTPPKGAITYMFRNFQNSFFTGQTSGWLLLTFSTLKYT